MGIRLTLGRHLRWEPGEDDDIPADLAPFAHAFEADWREALFTLAAEKIEAPDFPVVRFWRQLADRYLTQLCHLPKDTGIIEVEMPAPADHTHWVLTAPPMTGGDGDPLWCNVPAAVWDYRLGGYQVLKKWPFYREHAAFGRPLRGDEIRHFMGTARRTAAALLLTKTGIGQFGPIES